MRKFRLFPLAVLVALITCLWIPNARAQSRDITILYDNRPSDPGCATDWGFSCLIKGFAKTILFDIGGKEDVFLKNVKALNIDLKRTDILVISHSHSDHTEAIGAFLNLKPSAEAYLPDDIVPLPNVRLLRERVEKAGVVSYVVKAPQEIVPHVFVTGTMGLLIREQALVLETDRGLVVVTGCAHPGIVDIVKKARSIVNKDIDLLLGGFHLLNDSERAIQEIIAQFKSNKVKRVGATHCTGDKAIQMIKEAYGKDFVELGVGKKVVF